jgi:hypothetical protein
MGNYEETYKHVQFFRTLFAREEFKQAVCSQTNLTAVFFKMVELLKKFHIIDILERGEGREPEVHPTRRV